MTIPPWLNVSPDLFLQAAQAGTSAGINVAGQRQAAVDRQAALQQQADEAMLRSAIENARMRQDEQRLAQTARLQGRDQDIALQRLLQAAGQDQASNQLRTGELQARNRMLDFTGSQAAAKSKREQDALALLTGADSVTDLSKAHPEILATPAGRLRFGLENRPLTQADVDAQIMLGKGQPRANPASEVERMVNGRRAIFDATTKKFLRYAQ
jgi:hypothetical protein